MQLRSGLVLRYWCGSAVVQQGICTVHNSYSSVQPPSEDESVDLHFVALVTVNGEVPQFLDGN